ncbi:PREDICTED: E3 ubiquitin/ISG15 ligase TRIM25-like [Nanorana parkeri]|uniref:E3 ubiquitin/ISG15 ligase TRIM25-like n=1 Tax=Nanorana parkeri TaxID=125878 RepID=UPI0008542EC7|nr:PREDICTED: E3 ubiquitin/ISG15 ligase TRIM25-like [Nanorana parkeri]
MASADLRAELDCSICLNIYTAPVMLKCGHNFCRDCIGRVLDTQEESGVYFCPQCREEFQERPALSRNITLRNIVESFRSSHPEQKESGISCTYCIHASVPAVKSCLMCEAFLCDNHLKVHSKSPEHVLSDPTTSLEDRKCSIHKKVLEYYCTEDAACICVSCSLSIEHRGHQVDKLQEAFTKKKMKLANNLQKLIVKKEETERRVRSLQERRGEVQGKANGEAERVIDLFKDLRRRLEDLEKKILNEISRQEEQLLHPVNDLIQQLETKKVELTMKIRHIEELCNMTDPLTALQEPDKDDRRTASRSGTDQDRKFFHEIFTDYNQVLGSQSFSSGRHYWEVDVRKSNNWRIGMCYDSMERKGDDSLIGCNDVSWGLDRRGKNYMVIHDSDETELDDHLPCERVRVYLDYEAGQISFYMCDPIEHLHTFSADFTEPLYAVLGVWHASISLC